VAPQVYGLHGVIAPPWLQAPLPLQVSAAVCVPLVQEAATQTVPLGQSAHAPPLQLPSVPQVDAAVAMQMLRGSGWLFAALPQWPVLGNCWSDPRHAWHALVQALLQQTPSAQKPLVHWSAAVHEAASAFLARHMPPLQ
jgi:hypothetical protein